MFTQAHEDLESLQEKKIQELITKFERLEEKFAYLFAELQTNPEELSSLLSQAVPSEELQKIRSDLEQELHLRLSVKNPRETKTKYQDLRRAQNWIPVR